MLSASPTGTARRLFVSLVCISIFLCMSQPVSAQQPGRQPDDRIADVVEMAGKAIVNIKTEEISKTESDEKKSPPSLFRKYFSSNDEVEELVENIGSGVVLDPKGIVVTNEHLIARAINIRVKFINGKEYEAYVLGSDPEYDIALLKIISDRTDFPHLTFSQPSEGVLQITLEGPNLNAVGPEAHRELADVWIAVDRDPTVRVAVLTGDTTIT